MIQILAGFPGNVVAAAAHDVVTRSDYQDVLVPRIQEALEHYPKVRLYYELGKDFSAMQAGAMWEDFKAGFEHLTRWERIAVVTDTDWVRHAVNAFRFLMPGNVRVFATSQAAEARVWIAATQA